MNENLDSCSECEDDYYLDQNSNCQKIEETLFCFEYEFNICVKCIQGYYLDNYDCLKIPIKNCIKFENEKCSKCTQDSIPIYNNDEVILCIDNLEEFHCKKYTGNETNNQKYFKCTECESLYTLNPDNIDLPICLFPYEISNCYEYAYH